MQYKVRDPVNEISYEVHDDFSIWYKSLSNYDKNRLAEVYLELVQSEDLLDLQSFGLTRKYSSDLQGIKQWFSSIHANSKKSTQGFIVARANNIIVGLTCFSYYAEENDNVIWLSAIVVTRMFRKQGIAQHMIQQAIDYSKQIIPKCIIGLRVNAANEAGLTLYKKLGFNTTISYTLINK